VRQRRIKYGFDKLWESLSYVKGAQRKDCKSITGLAVGLITNRAIACGGRSLSTRRYCRGGVATIAGLDSARAPHVSGDSDGYVLSRLLLHTRIRFASAVPVYIFIPVDIYMPHPL
jgi:hypothetical protein